MAVDILNGWQEVRREDESNADKRYVYENSCERDACIWAEESVGKSHFKTNAEKRGVLEAVEVLQSPNAGGGRRSGVGFGRHCLARWD